MCPNGSSSFDKFFTYVEGSEVSVVVFMRRQSPRIQQMMKFIDSESFRRPHINFLIFFPSKINMRDIQIVRFPQIRIYKKGTEVKSLVGDEIYQLSKVLTKLS